MPWLAKSYETFTWTDPNTGETKSGVRFTIRDDVYWNDGVPFRIEDVIFTLWEFPKALIEAGFPPPSWYHNVRDVLSYYIVDPYTVEILLDVKSVWATSLLGENIMLPQHIWEETLEKAVTGEIDITGFSPDPLFTGTGMWTLEDYEEGNYVLLSLNMEASSFATPLETKIDNDVSSHIIVPGMIEMFNLTCGNLLADQYLEANISASLVNPNATLEPLFSDLIITLLPSESLSMDIGPLTFDPGYYRIEFNAAIQPQDLWLNLSVVYDFDLWVTISEDLNLDFKVNMRDIGLAARAFGSFPGHPRWNPVADVIKDYRVNMRDIGATARKFGWAGATENHKNHYKLKPWKWKTMPIKYKVEQELIDKGYLDEIQDAIEQWTSINGVNLQFKYDGPFKSDDLKYKKNGVNEIRMRKIDCKDRTTAATFTWVSRKKKEIKEFDIVIDSCEDWQNMDMEPTVKHEIGHAIGLRHVRCKKEIMYWNRATRETNTLGEGDKEGAKRLYPKKPKDGIMLQIYVNHLKEHQEASYQSNVSISVKSDSNQLLMMIATVAILFIYQKTKILKERKIQQQKF